MSAVRSGLSMNWANVVITPATGSPINLGEVTDVNPGLKSENVPFYGDNRRFAKMLRATKYERSVSITTGDAATANSIPVDQPVTINATLCDARNGTGAGALVYTFKNAVMDENSLKAANNQYGEVTLMFRCFGDDSTQADSDPFSFVVTQ